MMHHAHLLVGNKDWALTFVPLEDRTPGLDADVREYDRMSIKEVRGLIADAQRRPVSRAHRSFVLICDSLLHEAQNALLKLLEEPHTHTVFYVIVPREDMLLPTLRSRLNLLSHEQSGVSHRDTEVFSKFRQASYSDRLREVGERTEAKDEVWMNGVLYGASVLARTDKNARLMEDILMIESYIHSPGCSKKMLLEHLALSV